MLLSLAPVVFHKTPRGDTISIDEYQVVTLRRAYRAVENRILPPAAVFVENMGEGYAGTPAVFIDDLLYGRTRTVIGDKHFEVIDRLSRAGSKD